MAVIPSFWLGRRDYIRTWQAMQHITDTAGADSAETAAADQVWFLEHPPVFTQGQAGRAEHVLAPGDIPVVPTDRGGQVTYHGPGQLVVYPLLDLRHLSHGHGLGIRSLVEALEKAIIDCLAGYDITARGRRDAPGVYVGEDKIASIGLRVRRRRCYHGIALNVAMDLEPYGRINPCGYQGLSMTQISALGGPSDLQTVRRDLHATLGPALGIELGEMQNAGHQAGVDINQVTTTASGLTHAAQ